MSIEAQATTSPTGRSGAAAALVAVALLLGACGSTTEDVDSVAGAAAAETESVAQQADSTSAPETEATEAAAESDETDAEVEDDGESHDSDTDTDAASADEEHDADEEHADSDGEGDDDHHDDEVDDHGGSGEGSDHDHANEPEGELLTEASDGTPEIGTVVEPGSPVPAGTYVLNILGEEWRLDVVEETLQFGGSDLSTFGFGVEELAGKPHFVGLLKTVGIVPPREVGIHQEHDPIIPEVTVDIPADLGTWLDAVPQVVVVDTGTSAVAGAPATWYRLTVDPAAGQTFHCPFGDHCAGFIVHPNFGVTVLSPEIDVTVWQLEALPHVMPWVQVEDPADVEAAQTAMATMLSGIRPA